MKLKMLLTSILFAAATHVYAAEPVMIPGGLTEIFAADGYDSNDHIQITGHGILPSSCHKPAFSDWKLVGGRDIVLSPTVYYYSGYCLQMISHSYPTFEIGILPTGNYRVLLEKTGEVLGRISIRKATTEAADDFLYAPISQAYHERKGSRNVIHISGAFSNSCVKLKEVRVNVQANVIVVLPISEVTSNSSCSEGSFPFERSHDVGRLTSGRYMIHVRSLNGTAVNTLFDVR